MAHTYLLVISGQDQPGITSDLLNCLPDEDVVIDVQQILSEGMLTLHLMIRSKQSINALHNDLVARMDNFGVELSIHEAQSNFVENSTDQLVVTVMAQELAVATLSHLTRAILQTGCNIDSIQRVAKYPVTALELRVSGGDITTLRLKLSEIAIKNHIDLAVQSGSLQRRGRHLIVLDVDSTLIQEEVIDLLGEFLGVRQEIAAITEQAMRGEIDFESALRQRVHLLSGTPMNALSEVQEKVTLSPGARTLFRVLKYLDYNIALVSGGFDFIVEYLAKDLGADAFKANRLEVVDGVLTGKIQGDVIDRNAKAQALIRFAQEFEIPIERTIAIGDGANDIDMMSVAGLGIAFNAKPAVQKAADTSVNVPYLDSILYLLGITRGEIEQLNRELGAASFPLGNDER